MKLKAWKVKIKLFNWSWIMAFIDTLHIIIILAVKVKMWHLELLTFRSYFISFFFWGLYFSKSFDLYFRTFYPIFVFLLFLIFQNMGKQLTESKLCTYLQDYQSQFKIYEPYYYRTLTERITSSPQRCVAGTLSMFCTFIKFS